MKVNGHQNYPKYILCSSEERWWSSLKMTLGWVNDDMFESHANADWLISSPVQCYSPDWACNLYLLLCHNRIKRSAGTSGFWVSYISEWEKPLSQVRKVKLYRLSGLRQSANAKHHLGTNGRVTLRLAWQSLFFILLESLFVTSAAQISDHQRWSWGKVHTLLVLYKSSSACSRFLSKHHYTL